MDHDACPWCGQADPDDPVEVLVDEDLQFADEEFETFTEMIEVIFHASLDKRRRLMWGNRTVNRARRCR